jgi:phosphoribosyl 1,2-cyclic phosphodiesterase
MTSTGAWRQRLLFDFDTDPPPPRAGAAMELCVLASGSSGNSTLLRPAIGAGAVAPGSERPAVLVDLGLSPRRTRRHLAELGVELATISDILLTHADHDHLHAGWANLLSHMRANVWIHRRHASTARALGIPACSIRILDLDGPTPIVSGRGCFRGVLVPHDEHGSVAFRIEIDGLRLGFATDLGAATPALFDLFETLDALAIESNYDPVLQQASPRPEFLKRRIMDGAGHLSNHQSLEAARRIADRSPLQHIALLHLSRQCNEPAIVRRLWHDHAAALAARLTLSSQHEPTAMLRIAAPGGAGEAVCA